MSKELIAVLRIILSIAVGATIAWYWLEFRPDDEPIIAYAAGLISAVMLTIVLAKLRGD